MNPLAIRAALVVGVAIVLGAFILGRGLDDAPSVAVDTEAPADPTATPTPEATETVEPTEEAEATEDPGDATEDEGDDAATEPTEELPPAANNPADVTVLVANGSGVDGAAGRTTSVLSAAGFNTLSAVNAELQDASIVYFAAGFEADGLAVAQALGGGQDRLQALVPETPPAGITDVTGVNVLVVLGGPAGTGDELVQAG